MSKTVDIKIKTTADNSGIDKTTKSLDSLDNTQGKVNKTSKESKASSISASQGFASLGQAASAASSGGIGPLAGALGGLSQQLPALAGAAGPIGLAIAAFMAWKSAIDAVIASDDQLQANLTNISIGNTESQVKRLNDSYKELTDQLSAASAEINRFYNAESSGDDAIKRAELAKLELEAAEKRAKLDRNDQFAGPRLDLEIAQKKSAIEAAATERGFARDQKAIGAQTTIEQTAMVAAKEQQDALAAKMAKLLGDQMEVTARASEKSDKWYNTPKAKEDIWTKASADIQRIATQMEGVKTQMQAAAKAQEAAAGALASLTSAGDITALNQATFGTTTKAGSITRSTAAADINYAQRSKIETETAAAQKSADAIRKKRSELQQSSTKEWGDYTKAKRDGAGTEEIKKQLAEYKEANALLRQYFQESSSLFTQNNQDIKKALETIRNLP